jgi:cobyrinic acid a,c-diamide synthase
LPAALPRLVIAGTGGDAGKSLVTLGLARAAVRRGWRVAPFKKGPDFIDAAWLGAAAKAPGRNLDTFLMTPGAILGSLERGAAGADLALIEGNRGLFDGLDAQGTHSTASLARLVQAPVVLVVPAVKVTRTVAALVLGCKALEPDLWLAGVVLNRVANARQEAVLREAVASATGVPVLGVIPRLEDDLLPTRHLGLVCESEHPDREAVLEKLGEVVGRHVDMEAAWRVASTAPPLPSASRAFAFAAAGGRPDAASGVRVGVLRDRAFSFYYPENLEALEAAGAELFFISPLSDETLPRVDALYAGGGFPEEHAAALSANAPLREAIAAAVADGLPVWAECGGLMYLSKSLWRDGREYPMVGALPASVEVRARPEGHGYVSGVVDGENPFFARGARLVGHEFHYSRLRQPPEGLRTVVALERGTGVGGRDGLAVGNAVATWTHLHAVGVPEWAPALVGAARSGAAPRLCREHVSAAREGP